MKFRLFVLTLVFIPAIAFADDEGKSLDQLQKEEKIQKAIDALNNMDAKLDILIKQRESDCQKAIGYKPFCSCVLTDLPVAWSFADYVAITTKTKEDNQYSKMPKDYQDAYDKVPGIRDKCVLQINSKQPSH